MRSLRFGAALVAATLVHLLGVEIWSGFSLLFDVFLVLAVFNGLDGETFAGLWGGLAAGLVTDAVTGGLYGLHGLADTMVGYGTAYATQRLVVQRPASVFLVFSLAGSVQLLTLAAIVTLLLPNPELPAYYWILGKVAATGLLGVLVFLSRRALLARFARWRRTRKTRIRMNR